LSFHPHEEASFEYPEIKKEGGWEAVDLVARNLSRRKALKLKTTKQLSYNKIYVVLGKEKGGYFRSRRIRNRNEKGDSILFVRTGNNLLKQMKDISTSYGGKKRRKKRERKKTAGRLMFPFKKA
jgi:hypothetical protein